MDRELLTARLKNCDIAAISREYLPSIARIVAMYVCDLRELREVARIIESATQHDELRDFAMHILAPTTPWFPIIAAWNLRDHCDSPTKCSILAGDYEILDTPPRNIHEIAQSACGRAIWSDLARDIDIVATHAQVSARIRAQLTALVAILATDPRSREQSREIARNSYSISASTTMRDLTCMIICQERAQLFAKAPNHARDLVNIARKRLRDVSLDEEEEVFAIIDAPDYVLRGIDIGTDTDTARPTADVLTQLRNDTWIARSIPFSIWQRANDEESARAMLALDALARELGVPRANGRARLITSDARASRNVCVVFDALHIADTCDAQACIANIADIRARINVISVCAWRHIMAIETSGSASANVLISRDGAFIYSCAEFPRLGHARGSAHIIAHRNIMMEYSRDSVRNALCERVRGWLARLEELARIEGIAERCSSRARRVRMLPAQYLADCTERARNIRATWDARIDACRFERVVAVI